MRKIVFSIWLLLSFVYISAASAITLEYDFRTADWSGADGQQSFTVGSVEVEALGGLDLLWQDAIDGLGIKGGENDEIDNQEMMFVYFDSPEFLTDVFITDLFEPIDGDNNSEGEKGVVELYDDGGALLGTYDFSGINSDQANGEILVSFGTGVSGVSSAKFYADNQFDLNNEFSVAGFNSEVPEPTTLMLFGAGLAGLAGYSRRKK